MNRTVPIVLPEFSQEDHEEFFKFLDELRDSGRTNMFGAAPYLMEEFELPRYEARAVLKSWMEETARIEQ